MDDYIQRNRDAVQAKKASAYSQELAKRTAKPEKLGDVLARVMARLEARERSE